MLEEKKIKYRAFISYSHADTRTVNWLYRSLETYRLPKRLVGQETSRGDRVPERLLPIFRDRDELASATRLSDAIQDALAHSAALIVVCSKAAARSHWVNREILEFQRLGKGDEIYCVILNGTPGSLDSAECFPPALRGEDVEPLAADLRPGGDTRRGVCRKLIAGIIGINLDDLVMRDQRRRMRQLALVASGAILTTVLMSLLALSAYFSQQHAEQSRNQAEELIGFMLGELREKLEPIGRLDVLDSVASKAMDYFSTVEQEQLSDDILVKRSVALRQVGEVRMFQGKLAESLDAFDKSLQLAQRLADRNPDDADIHFELGQIQFWNGHLYWQQQDYDAAEKHFGSYLNTALHLIGLDGLNPRFRAEEAYAYMNLGSLFSRQNKHARARDSFEQSILQFERLSAEYPENLEYSAELTNGYSWLGGELVESGDMVAAIEIFKRLTDMLELLRANDSHADLTAQLADGNQFLANLYLARADLVNAEAAVDQTRQLYFELTTLDPGNMVWLRGYAFSFRFEFRLQRARGDLEGAIRAIEQAGDIIHDVADKTDIESYRTNDVASIKLDEADILLGSDYVDREKLGAAESLLVDAMDLLADIDSHELARAHLTMGRLQNRRGDPLRAAASWQAAETTLSRVMNTGSNRLEDRALLTELLFHTGRTEQAATLFAQLQKLGYKEFSQQLSTTLSQQYHSTITAQ